MAPAAPLRHAARPCDVWRGTTSSLHPPRARTSVEISRNGAGATSGRMARRRRGGPRHHPLSSPSPLAEDEWGDDEAPWRLPASSAALAAEARFRRRRRASRFGAFSPLSRHHDSGSRGAPGNAPRPPASCFLSPWLGAVHGRGGRAKQADTRTLGKAANAAKLEMVAKKGKPQSMTASDPSSCRLYLRRRRILVCETLGAVNIQPTTSCVNTMGRT